MIDSESMKTIEKEAEEKGIKPELMMENAAHGFVEELSKRKDIDDREVAIVCGTGNNGGDGFCIARHLLSRNSSVKVYVYGNKSDVNTNESKLNLKIIENIDMEINEITDETEIPDFKDCDILIDSILGIGLKGKLRGFLPQLIEKMNESNAYKVAVDVPTGINSDTGQIPGKYFQPDLTVTFHDEKPGLDEKKCGEIVVKSIGLPDQKPEKIQN